MKTIEIESRNVDLHFRYKATTDSEYFGIIYYYSCLLTCKRGSVKVRDIILESASTYWQPFVLLKEDRREALNTVINCDYRIKMKIIELERLIELISERKAVKSLLESGDIFFKLTTRIPRSRTNEARLALYLKSDEDFKSSEKILWSSDSLQGITAYLELGSYDRLQIVKKAERCIEKLKSHRQLFRRVFSELADNNPEGDTPKPIHREITINGNNESNIGGEREKRSTIAAMFDEPGLERSKIKSIGKQLL